MANPINDAEFDSLVLKSELPVFVDFWAPWCGPCRATSPIVEELSQEWEGKVTVYKMNVDENMTIPGRYNIMSIPTFMLFKNGEIAEQIVGARSKAEFQQAVSAHL